MDAQIGLSHPLGGVWSGSGPFPAQSDQSDSSEYVREAGSEATNPGDRRRCSVREQLRERRWQAHAPALRSGGRQPTQRAGDGGR